MIDLISTHTPLAGRDLHQGRRRDRTTHFYSHAPRGARHHRCYGAEDVTDFYSHAPRGARHKDNSFPRLIHISTHTPLAGRDLRGLDVVVTGDSISTHTPLAGRDRIMQIVMNWEPISTHTPLAGRDLISGRVPVIGYISTHTPLAGRDQSFRLSRQNNNHFYSHAPRGARHEPPPPLLRLNVFLLTRPSRGATENPDASIADVRFLLTRPSRGATFGGLLCRRNNTISTHTPLAGRDRLDLIIGTTYIISTHTPLAGRDPAVDYHFRYKGDFYSHAPRGARP